jgi:hypothetical protein
MCGDGQLPCKWEYVMRHMFEAGSDCQLVIVLSHVPRLLLLQGFDIYKHFDRMLTKNVMMLMECLPVKIKAAHACLGSGKVVFELVHPVLKQIVGKQFRLHTNIHVSCWFKDRSYA